MNAIDIIKAIKVLVPNARPLIDYQLLLDENGNYFISSWNENVSTKPEISDIEPIRIQLEQERISTEYKDKRKREYPPMEDYLDGIVKGDQDQIQAYIDACLAVKAKYPKS